MPVKSLPDLETQQRIADAIEEIAIKLEDTYATLTQVDGKLDKNTNITGATKTKITYDSKGLVTAGADLVEADIPELSASKITQTTSARFVTDAEKSTWDNKQDKLIAGDNITIVGNTISASGGGGVDLNEMSYFDYAGSIYGAKYNLLVSAWNHSLTVDPLEISENSTFLNARGTLQYPNGETEGVIIPHGIVNIGNYAFSGWTSNNQPLVIPNSVTTISISAFWNWTSNNQPLVIPNSVTSIGNNVFYNWTSNNQPLVIPNSVTSIGSGVFGNWTSNNQPLVIPNSVTSIGTNAFGNWAANNHPLVIPDSVTDIGAGAFNSWSKVPYIEMKRTTPPTLANSNVFDGQNNAPIYVPDASVTAYKIATYWSRFADRIFPISDKDKKIEDAPNDDKLYGRRNNTWEEVQGGGGEVDLNTMSYFDYAGSIYGAKYSLLASAWGHSLTVDPSEISENSISSGPYRGLAQYPDSETEGIIIPHGITIIGNYSFRNSINNQPLVIPNSVTNIGDSAFRGWTSNNQPLVIQNSVTSIGNSAFSDWTSNNQPLTIPNSVTSIGQSAFSGWTSNSQPLTIPNGVTNIDSLTFYNWSSNNQPLIILDGVTSIGVNAFNSWSSNTHPLVIPNSVTSIASGAFYGWGLVPYIEMKRTTPPTLVNINAFGGQNDAPIYVPDESVNDYKTATNWVSLASRIFGISEKDEGAFEEKVLDIIDKWEPVVDGGYFVGPPPLRILTGGTFTGQTPTSTFDGGTF